MNVEGMLADVEISVRVKGKREVTGRLIGSTCVYIYVRVYVYIYIYICGEGIMKPTEYILKRRGAKKFKNPKHHHMRMSL
jgi:hypothetical protein